METFLAKIYAEDKHTLVLEVCDNKDVNNLIKLSTNASPYVRIWGADNVAISYEAKLLFIDILHHASKNYDKSTSLGIINLQNTDILITWNGKNKQKINTKNLQGINIGLGLGFSDENLLNLLQLKDNNFLQNFKFAKDHTQKVCDFLVKKYENDKIINRRKKQIAEREQ